MYLPKKVDSFTEANRGVAKRYRAYIPAMCGFESRLRNQYDPRGVVASLGENRAARV